LGKKFDSSYVFFHIPKLLSCLNTTLTIVCLSILLGFVIGLLVALPRLYKIPVLKRLSEVYISFFRGTPILIQLFLIYYGLPEILLGIHINVSKVPVLDFVILTYALNSGAFISEAIRSSVLAVDRGQVEAAYSIGMTGFQAFRRIVTPQSLALAVPVFANLVIANLKDTSLAFTLGVMELTGKAQTLAQLTQHFIETYIALALIYLALSLVLEKVFAMAEGYLLRYESAIVTGKKIIWGMKFGLEKIPSGIKLLKGGSRL
jgi:L-cystine transport system permease protein